jgi:hypothetical protein
MPAPPAAIKRGYLSGGITRDGKTSPAISCVGLIGYGVPPLLQRLRLRAWVAASMVLLARLASLWVDFYRDHG